MEDQLYTPTVLSQRKNHQVHIGYEAVSHGRSRRLEVYNTHYPTVEKVKAKVKESRNLPGVAQRVPGGLGSQISMTFGT